MPTQFLESRDNFFQPRNRRARQRFPFENHSEAAVEFAFDLHRFGILIGAAEKKIANPIGEASRFCSSRSRDGASALASASSAFVPVLAARTRKALAPSPNSPPNSPATRPGTSVRLWRSEANHGHRASLSGNNLRLRDRKRVDRHRGTRHRHRKPRTFRARRFPNAAAPQATGIDDAFRSSR